MHEVDGEGLVLEVRDSSNVLAPRKVNTAALRSCDDTMTEAPVGARPSRTAQRVEMPSESSRASTVSARVSLPSFTSALTSSPSRDMLTAELTAPPPVWVETSAASVFEPSFSSRKAGIRIEHAHALDAVAGDDRDGVDGGAADGETFHGAGL